MKKKHIYYVSYAHTKGFGSIQILMDKPLQTFEDVTNVRKHIEEENGLEVTILNWKELQK